MKHYQNTGRAAGPLYDVFLARSINQKLGGAFVAAWDVPHLDESTRELFLALHAHEAQQPNLPQNVRAVEEFKANYRRQFIKH